MNSTPSGSAHFVTPIPSTNPTELTTPLDSLLTEDLTLLSHEELKERLDRLAVLSRGGHALTAALDEEVILTKTKTKRERKPSKSALQMDAILNSL